MNYLAHTFLSFGQEYLLIGNFITDFINAKQARVLHDQYKEGVELHRKIDRFTDSHDMFSSGRRRLAKHHGKYAPVVLDILYDHLLAKNWKRYATQSIEEHAEQTYSYFEKHADVFVENNFIHLPKMINHNFLESYVHEDKVRYVLQQMDKRAKFESDFTSAMDHLLEEYTAYENEFNLFFPDIIKMVKTAIKI